MPGLTGFITITGSEKYPGAGGVGISSRREKRKENPLKRPSRKTGEEVDRRGDTRGVHYEAGQVPVIAAALSNACTSVC